MSYKITSVIFEVDAQNRDGQFTVPKKICDFLDVGPEDNVTITINGKSNPINDSTAKRSTIFPSGGNNT